MLYKEQNPKLLCNCGYEIDSFQPKEFCKDGLCYRGYSAICPNCGICYFLKDLRPLRLKTAGSIYSDAPYRFREYGGYKTWLCFCNRKPAASLIVSKGGWEAYCPHCGVSVLITDLDDIWEAPYIKLEQITFH